MKTLLIGICFAGACLAQIVSMSIGAPVFSGTGLNDATSGGAYIGVRANHSYTGTICSGGTPDGVAFTSDRGTTSGCTVAVSTSPVQMFFTAGTLTGASWAAGVATYTTASAHQLQPGELVTINAASPSAYNIAGLTIAAAPSSTTFTVRVAVNPGTWTSGGTVYAGNGITIKWGATTGHHLGDSWAIAVNGLPAQGEFMQKGIGAVVRSQHDRDDDLLNGADFGMKCDGVYVPVAMPAGSGGSGVSSITVSSAVGIVAGALVSGTGIATSTYVASSYTPGSTTVPLSQNTIGTVNGAVTFIFWAGTDNTSSMQSAGNYALSTGQELNLPWGACLFDGNLSFSPIGNESLTIRGHSPCPIVVMGNYVGAVAPETCSTQLISLKTDGSTFLNVNMAAAATPLIYLRDFAVYGLDYHAGALTATGGDGISIGADLTGGTASTYIERIIVAGRNAPGAMGIRILRSEDNSLTLTSLMGNNGCLALGNAAGTADASETHAYGLQCQLSFGSKGVDVENTGGLSWYGGLLQSNYADGLYMSNVNGVRIVGVHSENNSYQCTPNGIGECSTGAVHISPAAYAEHIELQMDHFGPYDRIIIDGTAGAADVEIRDGYNSSTAQPQIQILNTADQSIDVLGGYAGAPTTMASAFGGTTGLNDLSPCGTYTGATYTRYKIVVTAGTPDTFTWQNWTTSGAVSAPVAITGGCQTFDQGAAISFAATTGHHSTDYWRVIGAPYWRAEIEDYGHNNYVRNGNTLGSLNSNTALNVFGNISLTGKILTTGTGSGVFNLPAGSSTIDWSKGTVFVTNNTSPTQINLVSNGVGGQTALLIISDTNTTIANGAGTGRIVLPSNYPSPMTPLEFGIYLLYYTGSITLIEPLGYQTGVAAGAYGTSTQTPHVTVDAAGHIIAASNTAIAATTFSAGAGISVSGSPASPGGTVTIGNTGVTSLSASGLSCTSGQHLQSVALSVSTGAITLTGTCN